jgi:hypothetical protein
MSVPGSTYSVTNTDSFSHSVSLGSGSNTLSVTATDLAGNQCTATYTIVYDDVAPTTAIRSTTPKPADCQAAVLTLRLMKVN